MLYLEFLDGQGLGNQLWNYVTLRSLSNKLGYEYEIINAPGCFEIPYLIKKNIDNFKGFISLGCIIKGDTYHFEVIANETSRKIMDLSIEFNIPIGFGILTCYDLEQAKIRSDINQKNKGQEAALACIKLLK